jgi:tartrate dehydrogenase/decarboxylase/D-malate dehydrogenase
MKRFRIAVWPGDGIGIEVVREAVRVLKVVQDRMGNFELDTVELPWGGDWYFANDRRDTVPENFLDELKGFDAIFLGALGDPERLPDHLTLGPLVKLRQQFDQYVCMRPARLYAGVRSPLADPGNIDMIVLRENSEGEYLRIGGRAKIGRPEEVAVQAAIHTRSGVERILRFGFDLARTRRKRLTMITKSNALVFGMVLWDDIFQELRGEYADVESNLQHADAAAMDFVRRPQFFDVVVASNLFGDLLTDLGGVIVGGLGLAASSNINPQREFPSMFEPVHGSAPDIAGKGIANPTATILSAAMMMDWLGLEKAGNMIRSGVEATLRAKEVTRDLGGKLTTSEMGSRVIAHIEAGKLEPAPV